MYKHREFQYVIINPQKPIVMVAFTVTFMLLRFITTILYYIVVGICYAVFYTCAFTFMGIRQLYLSYRLRKVRGY